MASNPTPRRLNPDDPIPALGSVVMVHGLTGTAFQRLHSNGLFGAHSRQNPVAFTELFEMGNVTADPNVFLVHDTEGL